MSEARDAYVEMLKEKLDKWNAEIDGLQADAHKTQEDARARYQKQVDELKIKRQVLKEKMEELHHAGEGAWEDLKNGVDVAKQTLGQSIAAAKSRFE